MATDDTRSRILEAAGEVFAERGYQAATVREICRAAGVNLASVNYYFGDKERLYVETVRMAHPGQPAAEASPRWPEGTPPAEKLRAYIGQFVQRLMGREARPWKIRLIQREVLNPTPACRELIQSYFRTNFAALLEVLDELLPPGLPEAKRHQTALSIVGQCVYFRAATNVIQMIIDPAEYEEHFTAERLAEHVADFCLAALGAQHHDGEVRHG